MIIFHVFLSGPWGGERLFLSFWDERGESEDV